MTGVQTCALPISLGAVEELLRTDCKDPRYYASVAKNYLSFRYEERERAKKVCEEYFEKLMEEEGAELKKQLYSLDSEAQELFTEKTNLEVELEELRAEKGFHEIDLTKSIDEVDKVLSDLLKESHLL